MICGKKIYGTKTEAANAVRGSNQERRKSRRIKLKAVYFCEQCSGWHTTSGDENNKIRHKKFTEEHHKREAVVPREKKKYDFLNISTPNKFKIK